jgi:hypothetical protein
VITVITLIAAKRLPPAGEGRGCVWLASERPADCWQPHWPGGWLRRAWDGPGEIGGRWARGFARRGLRRAWLVTIQPGHDGR